MVMGRRPDVETAAFPISAVAVAGLAESMVNALIRVPFRQPWEGPGSLARNVGASVTRQVMRSFMGYVSSLPIEEFRSLEIVLDDLSGAILPPFVRSLGVEVAAGELGGVPGIWYRPKGTEARATILYLHGGGYIGTSPSMYAAFTGALAKESGCQIFVADYRLAPEFPFPAGLEDAVAVYEALLDQGLDPARLFLAGDSGGGGLVYSLTVDVRGNHLPRPAGVVLFSPEVDLRLDEPSVSENAARDILPWNIPTAAYLHGVDPGDERVNALRADLRDYPPVYVCFGGDEMFRDPIVRFLAELDAADVDVTSFEAASMFHVFPILMPWAAPTRRVFESMELFVARHVQPTDTDASTSAVTAT